MPIGTARFIQWIVKRAPENAGRMSHSTSTNRTATTSAAAVMRMHGLRLAVREIKRRKGRRNCPTSTTKPTQPQPPRKRARYQGISSGKLPDHTIRYCEKETYDQTMTKAKSILP